MAFRDKECNCDSYCMCASHVPCGCEGMAKDPHCEKCCQHLTHEQVTKWIQGVGSLVAVPKEY